MAMQKSKSLLAKYGQEVEKAAHAHATDETQYGIIRLPGGINNGIAQLFSCKFDVFKKGTYVGETYWQGRGTVIEPREVTTKEGTQRVRGIQTMIQEPVCKTKNQAGDVTTVDEHIDKILNHMRCLGGEDFTEELASLSGDALLSRMEELCEDLVELAPYFRFSTELSKPRPGSTYEPRVWENWHGIKGLEDYTPPDEESPLRDATGGPASEPPTRKAGANGEQTRKPSAVQTKTMKKLSSDVSKGRQGLMKGGKAAPAEEAPAFDDQGDTDTLLKRAKKGDDDAQQRLADMALEAGVPEEVVSDDSTTWDMIVAWIRGDAEIPEVPAEETSEPDEPEEEENEEEEAAEESEPEEEPEEKSISKGNVVGYKPLDPKTRKPAKKPTDHEVMTVDLKTRQATLRSLDTRKLVMGPDGKKPLKVSFDDLEPQDEE